MLVSSTMNSPQVGSGFGPFVLAWREMPAPMKGTRFPEATASLRWLGTLVRSIGIFLILRLKPAEADFVYDLEKKICSHTEQANDYDPRKDFWCFYVSLRLHYAE